MQTERPARRIRNVCPTVIARKKLAGERWQFALILAMPRPYRLGYVVSAGRYLQAAVPIFLVLARWARQRPWLDMLLASGGFLLQAAFAAYYLSGGWLV